LAASLALVEEGGDQVARIQLFEFGGQALIALAAGTGRSFEERANEMRADNPSTTTTDKHT